MLNSKQKILALSDCNHIRRIFLMAFRSIDVDLKVVSSVDEAIEFIGNSGIGLLKWKPNLIISDWRLADMHGLEFLCYARHDEVFKGTPFVLIRPLNGYRFLSNQILQPNAVISYPFNPTELHHFAKQLLKCEE